ncbi:conserved exported hypothetical protein [Thiocapsa sp. KS1]|nr:hypothetical protein [Thiocapsa sp. KS1]CRI68007.1 conserved exported hypothetical protein [Thiocapsa sp. KS1]
MPLRHPCLHLVLVGALVGPVVAAEPKIQGIYSNMEPSVEQGELIGTEIFILPHVENGELGYMALVQFADGLPARPQLVDLDVQGGSLSFTAVHPEEGEIRFTGSIDAEGLTGQLGTLGEVALPRGESIWQWGASGR